MSADTETRPEAEVMTLVRGIITDVHTLIMQQLALFEHDVRREIGHTVDAGSLVAVGFAAILTGGGLLCLMLVHLLAMLVPALPMWGCYGIVGIPVTVLGGMLCMVGIQRLRRFDNPPVEPAQDCEEDDDG